MLVAVVNELAENIRRALHANADPARAAGAQAYMKSAMPFLGVPVPKVRSLVRALAREVTFDDAQAFRDAVLALWTPATYREERYAALALCATKAAAPWQDLDALPMYEAMIVEGAWWDYVDEIAAHRLGELLRRFPKPLRATMRRWSRDANLWKRRSAILCQLQHKAATDFVFLEACIEPSLDSKEFFLRKAIGWALRQHARVDPAAVKRYVRANEARLSTLSRREALKHLA